MASASLCNIDDAASRSDVSSSTLFRLVLSNEERKENDSILAVFLRRIEREVGADAVIVLRNGNRLPVHLLLLAAHSAVLEKAFRQRTTEIDGRFAPPEAVTAVIDFLYRPLLVFSLRHLSDLLLVANTWRVNALKEVLEERLARLSLHPRLAIHCLSLALSTMVHVSTQMQDAVLVNAASNLWAIVDDPRFNDLTATAVFALLSVDSLPVRSELEVGQLLIDFLRVPSNRMHAARLVGVIRQEHLLPEQRKQLLRGAKSVNLHDVFREALDAKPTMVRLIRQNGGRFNPSTSKPTVSPVSEAGSVDSESEVSTCNSQSCINIRPRSAQSVSEINDCPDLFDRDAADPNAFLPRLKRESSVVSKPIVTPLPLSSRGSQSSVCPESSESDVYRGLRRFQPLSSESQTEINGLPSVFGPFPPRNQTPR